MPSVPGRVLAQVSVHHSSPFTALVPAYFRRGDRYTAGGAWSVGDGSAGGQSKLGSNPQFQLAVLRQRTRVVATLTQSQADHRAKPHGIVLFIVYKKVLLRTHRVARLFADFSVIAYSQGRIAKKLSRADLIFHSKSKTKDKIVGAQCRNGQSLISVTSAYVTQVSCEAVLEPQPFPYTIFGCTGRPGEEAAFHITV